MTLGEVMDILQAKINFYSDAYGADKEVIKSMSLYAANTLVGEGGISWFEVVGVMDVSTPDGGLILEITPRGTSSGLGIPH